MVKAKEEEKVKVGAEVSKSTYGMLLEICKWYRTDNVSHTMRLLIEDVWKGIQQNDPASRMSNGKKYERVEVGE